MTPMIKPSALAAAVLLALAAGASHAESLAQSASSAGSSASSAGSASLRESSDSSSGNKVADGDYRVIEVAERAERPGTLRLTLRATEAQGGRHAEWLLDLPRQALGERRLVVGDLVNARQRAYGIEFAHAAAAGRGREPFFLVLADDWYREIDPRAL